MNGAYKLGPHDRVKLATGSGSFGCAFQNMTPIEGSRKNKQLISHINSVFKAMRENNLDAAIKFAKDALQEAKGLGEINKNGGRIAVSDSCAHLLEEAFYGHIKREYAAARGVSEMRDRLAKELPDLCNTELNHQLKEATIAVDTLQLKGENDAAIGLAKESAAIAERNGLLYVAQDFRKRIFHIELDRALRESKASLETATEIEVRKAAEEKLGNAIVIMNGLLEFVRNEGIRTPMWLYEEAYMFAYSGKAAELKLAPIDVRNAIREGIPELPTNNYRRMENLEGEMKDAMERLLMGAERGKAGDLVEKAFAIIELSFLSQPEIYEGKRAIIRTLFENFAEAYRLRYPNDAKSDGYSFETLKAALVSKVPDLYSSNERLEMDAGFRAEISTRCAEAEEKLEGAKNIHPQSEHVVGNLTFAWQYYVNAAKSLGNAGEYALAAKADILAERIDALETAFQNASQKGTAAPAVATIGELRQQAAEFGKLFA